MWGQVGRRRPWVGGGPGEVEGFPGGRRPGSSSAAADVISGTNHLRAGLLFSARKVIPHRIAVGFIVINTQY